MLIKPATSSLSTSLAPNIFTDSTGQIVRPPTVLVNSSNGLFIGSDHLGFYSGSGWKTYMANNGNFYLNGPGTDSLSWVNGVLTINGAINITGGNAAKDSDAQTYAARAVTSGSLSASAAVDSASLYSANAAASASACKTVLP